MLTIHLQDTQLEDYVRKIGKEKIEEMFLSFLKSSTSIRDAVMPPNQQPAIRQTTDDKIKALNLYTKSHSSPLTQLYDTINETMGDRYAHLTDEIIRTDRMRDKGYIR